MLKNYLKIALRNISKYKAFSFINLLGLAIGMACCILILLYVQDELSYDRFHENADRIYRVSREWFNEDSTSSLHLGHVAPPIAPLLLNDFPDIVEAVRISTPGRMLVSHEDKHFLEENVLFAEASFFKVFTFPLVEGDPDTALQDPFKVVITEEMAVKYFGNDEPIGKTLKFENQIDAMVTGVVKKAPTNSHFHFDVIGSFASIEQMYGQQELQNWGSNNYATYLLMPENYPIQKLAVQMDGFMERHLGKQPFRRHALHLWKVTDIHLHSHLDSEIEANSDIVYVYIFSAIAFFILLIACINFMNLSTARSSVRAREVGMRKVVGAHRMHLIRQFLSESILLAFIALLIAVVLVKIALPLFSGFVDRDLSLSLIGDLRVLVSLLLIAFIVGVVAGSYPARFLSSFRPVAVLKGTQGPSARGSLFRTVLVIFQFAISIVLIISVGTVYKQLVYSWTKQLGFNQEQVVVLPTNNVIRSRYESIRTQLLALPDVVNVAASKRVPSGRLLDSSSARLISGTSVQPINFRLASMRIDYDFIPTYEIEMAAGRNFSREFSTDAQEAFVINETAAQRIGWTSEEAVGQSFQYGRRKGKIVGVVKDFHFESIHQMISPIMFEIDPSNYNQISVRLRPENVPQTMAAIEKMWSEYRRNYPFDYYFIDERFDQLYRSEEKLGQIFGVFSILAILIACLGLYGMASFTAEKRTKEIGIRKALGAPVGNIMFLLSKEFTKWVLVANVIAWPVAYLAMRRWLHSFAYRIDIGIEIFLIAGVMAFWISVLTISFQVIKAALNDPADALRYE